MFIVLEGIDNAGKSTLVKMIYNYLLNVLKIDKDNLIMTSEPSEFFQTMLEKDLWDNKELSLLFLLDKMVHIRKLLRPELLKNKIIICDRYISSLYGYQRNIPTKLLDQLVQYFIDLSPDLLFYINISFETYMKRLDGSDIDKYTATTFDDYKSILDGYSKCPTFKGCSTYNIDANGNLDDILHEIINYIQIAC